MKVGLRRLVAIMIAFALVLSYIPKSGLTLYNVHAGEIAEGGAFHMKVQRVIRS